VSAVKVGRQEPLLSFVVRPQVEHSYVLRQVLPDVGEAFTAEVLRVDIDWQDPCTGWVTMALPDGSVMKRRAMWP
jgi:hypothetical protein